VEMYSILAIVTDMYSWSYR